MQGGVREREEEGRRIKYKKEDNLIVGLSAKAKNDLKKL